MGYSTIGVHVDDFDAAIERIGGTSGRLLSDPIGERGRRRVCLYDTAGILFELMEDDPAPAAERRRLHADVPVAVRVVSSLYPALHRLERDKAIAGDWRTTENGRRVRYYPLTRTGVKRLADAEASWAALSESIGKILRFA